MSLKLLAEAVREILFAATKVPIEQIVIGPPHEAAKQQEENVATTAGMDYLCVFFYRIGYSGFPTDATSNDPLFLNAFCMITALGARSGNKAPGDSELELIGSVLECFHRHPVLRLERDGNVIAQLQILPTQLSLEDINHLWATQSQTPYRLSLGYEFALLPVPLASRPEYGGPPVQTIVLNTVSMENSDEP